MNTRREFLRTTALGAAVAGALPGLLTAAETGAASSSGPAKAAGAKPAPLTGIIDWHNHWISPNEIRILSGRTKAPRVFTDEKGQRVFERVTDATGAAGAPAPLPVFT